MSNIIFAALLVCAATPAVPLPVPVPNQMPAPTPIRSTETVPTHYDLLTGDMLLHTPEVVWRDWPTTFNKSHPLYVYNTPGIRAGVRAVAIRLQIMDPREQGYLMADVAIGIPSTGFVGDLKLLLTRKKDLEGMPLIDFATISRFPSYDEARAMVQFNRDYKVHLEKELLWNIDREDAYRRAITETDQLHAVWDNIYFAVSEYSYIPQRRHCLGNVRRLVGESAFEGKEELPPHVPTWRFRPL